MKQRSNIKQRRQKPIGATEVGRFLRHLSVMLKDASTGNPAMSEALLDLSTVLLDAKYSTASAATTKFLEQGGFDFDEEMDFGDLSVAAVQDALKNPNLTRAQLVILGVERFGIARSRLEKLPRDEIVRVVAAATQHEESLDIIAEGAKLGGQTRSS